MRLILVLLIVTFGESVAQRTYLTADELETSKSSAYYYRDISKSGSGYRVETYYKSTGKLRSSMTCSSVNPKLVREGTVTTYYENGNVQSIENYVAGTMTGLNSYFTVDGDSSAITLCRKTQDPERPFKQIYIQVWDKAGEPVLHKGSGVMQESTKNGDIVFSHYADSVITRAYQINVSTHDTVYLVAEKGIEFPRGLVKFYEFIGKNVKYPTKARRMGIQGRVFVEFIIEPDGAASSITVLKGIGGGCDEAAIEVLSSNKLKWLPAQQGGKPVRAKLVLPVTFILT